MTTVRDNREGLDENEEMDPDITPEETEQLAKIVQAENRVESMDTYHRAKASKDKSGSAAFKSQQRIMSSMRTFYSKVAQRNKSAGYHQRIFTDDKAQELAEDCGQYMDFCTTNEIIPT